MNPKFWGGVGNGAPISKYDGRWAPPLPNLKLLRSPKVIARRYSIDHMISYLCYIPNHAFILYRYQDNNNNNNNKDIYNALNSPKPQMRGQ